MKHLTKRNSIKGFTLLELIVVITIIGLIMGVLMVNFNNTRVRARDARRKAELDQISKALRMYYADYQSYPTHGTGGNAGKIMGCGSDGDEVCNWTDGFEAGGVVYIQQFPQDPLNNSDHQYRYERVNSDEFYLWVNLENAADRDIDATQSKCGVAPDTEAYVVCAN